MGVGYAEDLVVCVALGVDMFDCVFPTRTARYLRRLGRCIYGVVRQMIKSGFRVYANISSKFPSLYLQS